MPETIALCSILAIIVFIAQWFLCRKSNKTAIKLIPIYIIALAYFVAVLLYVIERLGGAGGVAIGSIFAFVIAIPNTVALIADLVAWLVHKLVQR